MTLKSRETNSFTNENVKHIKEYESQTYDNSMN